MGRKKDQGASQKPAFELRPFCYYCDREFDTAKTLVQHQRTKHCNCLECGLKFDTVTGLRVHMLNAYKKTLKEVPNAIPGRENPDIVVHGMEGIPKIVLEARTQKALAAHHEREAGERAKREARDAEAAEEAERTERQRREEAKLTVSSSCSSPRPSGSKVAVATHTPSSGGAAVPPPEMLTQRPREAPGVDPPRLAKRLPSRVPPSESRAPAAPQAPLSAAPPLPHAAMTGLSPAVKKLLLGDGVEAVLSSGLISMSGLPKHLVPPALVGLHPVALKVLACAGALLPADLTTPAAPGAGVPALPGSRAPSPRAGAGLPAASAPLAMPEAGPGPEPPEKRRRVALTAPS